MNPARHSAYHGTQGWRFIDGNLCWLPRWLDGHGEQIMLFGDLGAVAGFQFDQRAGNSKAFTYT
jgi:hypothetical protein